MNTEIIDFFYIYYMGRQLEDLSYELTISDIDEAVLKAGTNKKDLTEWLDENT